MSKIAYTALSQFEVKGDTLRVSDPCYDKSVWCTVTLKALTGTYHSILSHGELDQWGDRVASLTIIHESLLKNLGELEAQAKNDALFQYVRGNAGVDAGLCGFFDDSRYPGGGIEEDHAQGWNGICDELHSRKGDESKYMPWQDQGIFTSSGMGDGGYNVYADSPCDLKPVTAAKVVFIYPEEFECLPSEEDDREEFFENLETKQEEMEKRTKEAAEKLQTLLTGTQQNSQASHS
jgi:hypothetical protein